MLDETSSPRWRSYSQGTKCGQGSRTDYNDSNNLMTSDVDRLMEEESESSAGLSKVGWAGSTMISTVISTTVPTTMEDPLGGFGDDGAWRMVPYDDGADGS